MSLELTFVEDKYLKLQTAQVAVSACLLTKHTSFTALMNWAIFALVKKHPYTLYFHVCLSLKRECTGTEFSILP